MFQKSKGTDDLQEGRQQKESKLSRQRHQVQILGEKEIG
jgi:hypothetical protein